MSNMCDLSEKMRQHMELDLLHLIEYGSETNRVSRYIHVESNQFSKLRQDILIVFQDKRGGRRWFHTSVMKTKGKAEQIEADIRLEYVKKVFNEILSSLGN